MRNLRLPRACAAQMVGIVNFWEDFFNRGELKEHKDKRTNVPRILHRLRLCVLCVPWLDRPPTSPFPFLLLGGSINVVAAPPRYGFALKLPRFIWIP
jgi:hypothetical protein